MTREEDAATLKCDGCTACCWNTLLVLHPELGDRIHELVTRQVPHPYTGRMVHILAHREDGACYYLGDGGCTLHGGRKPYKCRVFDCRRLYLMIGRQEQARMIREGSITKDVFDAGRDRLATLSDGSD